MSETNLSNWLSRLLALDLEVLDLIEVDGDMSIYPMPDDLSPEAWEALAKTGIDIHSQLQTHYWPDGIAPRESVMHRKAVELARLGLASESEQTRWGAWLAFWRLSDFEAIYSLYHDGLNILYSSGPRPRYLPEGPLMIRGSMTGTGGGVPLVAPSPSALAPLLGSKHKIDREMALRLMATCRQK